MTNNIIYKKYNHSELVQKYKEFKDEIRMWDEFEPTFQQFKDWKNGQYKMISFFAKKARGLMARYIIQNQISNVEQVKDFDLAGYQFSCDLSQGNELVFTRKINSNE